MASHDAKAFAHLDFYSILDIDILAASEQKDIDRAWRKFALKYHPDKVSKNNAADAEAFYHQGRIGKEILSDPTAKQLYDDTRAARERKRQQDELLDARRKKLRDDLDRREKGVKRSFDDSTIAEDKATQLEREIQRIAADGKRRRLEKEAQLREERQRKIDERLKARQAQTEASIPKPEPEPTQPSEPLPDIDRTVRAKFRRNPTTAAVDGDRVWDLFSTFGSIANVFIMKDKREKISGSKEKIDVCRCGVIFKSILGAYDAVEEWKKEMQMEPLWNEFIEVIWAAGKEPDCIANIGIDGDPSAALLTAQEQVMIRLKKASRAKLSQGGEISV